MSSNSQPNTKNYTNWILGISISIPLAVTALIYIPGGGLGNFDVSYFPHINAVLNSSTAFLLILGFVFIKSKNIAYHRICMATAFILSSCFLVLYVLYHFQTESTKFGGEGSIRFIYFLLLISHILLAVAVVPLVLYSLFFAFTDQIEKHKKIVKWTFPVWLYVAITGVIVYFMIKPYYI